ncbi:MAG: phosphonate C-P lyase system protein PhnH [Pseudomonadota bacterium]
MLAPPQPDAEDMLANGAFAAILDALSRPGTTTLLPAPGPQVIVPALIDRECRVYADQPGLERLLADAGAKIVPLHQADHVFFGPLASAEDLARLNRGSDLYPDDGATVVIEAQIGHGNSLRLSGPGIDGTQTIALGGLPAGFWAARESVLRYPMGFDLLVVDEDRLLGVPRSTKVEVL